MSVNASECSNQLENQIDHMSNYLEKLLVTSDDGGDEIDSHNFDCAQGFPRMPNLNKEPYQAQPTDVAGFSGESHVVPYASDLGKPPFNPINFSQFNYGLVGASPQNTQNTITSVLANTSHSSGFTHRYPPNSTSHPRMKKRINYKQADKDPDTSGIDIDATMIELGLTPETFKQNDVHKLFSLFSDLEFSIHAEYISRHVYDEKTIPNTMSVSAQTKYAHWSSYKLLRNLREVLKRPMPAEYKSAYNKCEEALCELQQAIGRLDVFKHCTLEHRKGSFISYEAQEYLQPLMDALNHLTECVEKSRMFIQVYERALNAPERYKAALLAARGDEDHPQPAPQESYVEVASTSRPEMARRYIG